MADKKTNKNKSINLIIVLIAVAVIVGIGYIIGKSLQNNSNWEDATKAEQIKVEEADSNSVKVEKIQAKINLLNKDINELQNKLNEELEEMNMLYQDYTVATGQSQTNATEEQ